MTIEDQNGVDRVDRKAQWPHFLNKETRFCFVAQRVMNMRWGRRCWDCPKGGATNVRSTPYLRHVAETWHIWCDVAEQALVEAERPSNASSFGARLNILQISQPSKYITFKDESR